MTVPGVPDAIVAPPAVKPGPVGIGGWLILPVLGFIGTILLTGWSVVQALQSWEGLVAIFTATEGQLAQLKLPTAVSLIGGILVIASAAYCLYLMFAKKRAMVRFATAHYLILAVAGLGDLWAGFVMERVLSEPNDPTAIKEAVRGVVIAFIWIPYFHASKRVRNTFTA
jgi:hypothetical protein